MSETATSRDGWEPVKLVGFMEATGPLLRPANRDEGTLFGLQTTDIHGNRLGLLHGGVFMTLLDQVMAIVAWNAADRQPSVTVQMDTRFMGSARPGAFLECRAQVRRQTGSLVFVDGEVGADGALLATATAVMKIARPPEGAR